MDTIAYGVLSISLLLVAWQVFLIRRASKRAERLDKLYKEETASLLRDIETYLKR